MNNDLTASSPVPMEVVFVDDDHFFLERISRNLRGTDWGLTCFSDACMALDDLCQAGCPDVLVVDYHMPRLDGLDLLEKLRACTDVDGSRFYLCSIVPPPRDVRERAEKLGVDLLCKKAILDGSDLLETLRPRP